MIGKTYNLLDSGFIKIIDLMGSDNAIVQAARVSYGDGTKTQREDEGLIRYLMKHRHCYHPDMEVLTKRGWIQWKNCEETELYAVPNLANNEIRFEELSTLIFDADEELHCFKSNKVSYKVTGDHRMYYKPKYQKEYRIYRAAEMKKWGNFYSIRNFQKNIDKDTDFMLLGFFLGDGYAQNNKTMSFHLKKQRKIEYITNLLNILNIPFKTVKKDGGSTLISCDATSTIKTYTNFGANCKEKYIVGLEDLTIKQLAGLFCGLISSDGHIDKVKPRYHFSSYSTKLLKQFETISSILGYSSRILNDGKSCNASFKSCAELEARRQYFYTEHYKGKVYCATSSTGLLLVRGEGLTEGFVCGNTSPFEMCEIKLHIKLPIFIARQWIRHRTANVNEISARYSILPEEFYIPSLENIKPQAQNNKQGRAGEIDEKEAKEIQEKIINHSKNSYGFYKELLGNDEKEDGIARELARMSLPVNMYTEWYWKIDLHNLLHFIKLRIHPHAQYEIRVYAQALLEIVKEWCPFVYGAFVEYVLNAKTLSKSQIETVKLALSGGKLEQGSLSKREFEELKTIFE